MTISWPLSRQQVLDESGRPLLVPRVNFYAGGTTNPITVFKDAARTQPWTQPVVADGFGRFPRVYLPEGLYREEMLGPYGDTLWNDDGLGEAILDETTDPEVVVDPTAIPTTGDVKWRLDASIQPGWVRMNARTLGGAGSGATEFADATAMRLFTWLWSTFPDAIASVVGGRGTTAAGDFSAGKAITVPTMQGLVAGGLDDMGSSAAGRLQTIVDLALVEGSLQASVADASRLSIGMTVTAPGLSAGTIIQSITGNGLTLSQPASAGSTGSVSGRFSTIGDAQMPGQAGGDYIVGMTVAQLPPFTPTGTISAAGDHAHNLVYQRVNAGYGGGSLGAINTIGGDASPNSGSPTEASGGHGHSFTGSQIGSGQAHPNLQPTRLGTFYMKL